MATYRTSAVGNERSAGPVADAMRAVAERLRGRLDEVAAEVFEAIRREVRVYQASDRVEEDAIREGIRANIDLFLRLLAEGRDLAPAEEEVIESLGQDRARQGVPVESLQEAVGVGMQVGLGVVADDVERHFGNGEVAEPLLVLERVAARAVGFVHHVHVIVANGYRAVERERLTTAVHGEMRFVDRLVEGVWTDTGSVRRAAEEAGVCLTAPSGLVVVTAGNGDREAVAVAIETLRKRVEHVAAGSVHGGRRARAAALCPLGGPRRRHAGEWGSLTASLETLARDHGVVMVAERLERLEEVAAVHDEIARHLADVPGDLGAPGVMSGCDLAFLAACRGVEVDRARRVVHETLGPLLADRRRQPGKYLETLDVLHRCTHKKEAARRLGITLSALHARCGRICELTGLDPNLPSDAFRLRLAAALHRMHAGTLPPPGHPSWGRG